MTEQITKLQQKLKTTLAPKRYEHTIGVMYTAAALAMCYRTDLNQALLAGLLHDCAKAIPDQDKVALCRANGLEVNAVEAQNPSLLHAKLGEFLARRDYGLNDPQVLGAIRWHTTGRPRMSRLEMIIFIADYIEPNRSYLPHLKDRRALAFENLEACIVAVAGDSLNYLRTRDIAIDPMTEATYQYYNSLIKGDF